MGVRKHLGPERRGVRYFHFKAANGPCDLGFAVHPALPEIEFADNACEVQVEDEQGRVTVRAGGEGSGGYEWGDIEILGGLCCAGSRGGVRGVADE